MIHANVETIPATILTRPRRQGAENRRSPRYPHVSHASRRKRSTAAQAGTARMRRAAVESRFARPDPDAWVGPCFMVDVKRLQSALREPMLQCSENAAASENSRSMERCVYGLHRKHKTTVPEIRGRKGGVPLVCLTAYTTPMARLLDSHVDLLLVGDSLAMVIYGHASTLSVTLETMIAHGGAVVRGSELSVRDRRHAVRQLSGNAGARVSQRGPRHGGIGLRRRKARGWRRDGRDHRISHRPRNSGSGTHRPHAAVGPHRRRLPGARARAPRTRPASWTTPRRSRTQARSRW